MNQHIKILNQIAAIRDLHHQIEHICLNGSCMNFHVVLRRIYSDAVPYFNIDHVITKIGNKYYDITGCVNPKGYMPLTSFYDKRNTKRAVNQMMKYENLLKQEDIELLINSLQKSQQLIAGFKCTTPQSEWSEFDEDAYQSLIKAIIHLNDLLK